jgi:hypothetical protein
MVEARDEIIESEDTGIDIKSDALTSVFGRSHVLVYLAEVMSREW